MADFIREFDHLTERTSLIQDFNDINELKEFYENIAEEVDILQEKSTTELIDLKSEQEELKSGMGFRDKFLGGHLGGNREKVDDNQDLTESIETLNGLVENITTFQDTLGNEVMDHAADLISENDDEFAQSLEFQGMMVEAVEYTEEVLREIDEALEALDNAEDAEEMDLMTDSAWLDMESDQANSEAADEVQDVTELLIGYREFLNGMGESAVGLHGSDFDFSWGDMMNESFFGDFWGGSAMLDKIAQGQNQMLDLRDKIGQLYESFSVDYDRVCEEIETRINEEWDNS